jgi:succinate dehydrogenase/fumarate reductase flavoprotein subunit
MQWAMEAAVAAAQAKGAELMFATWGEQLIVEGGKVVGAFICDAEGNYSKVNAKSVVVTTGDFGGNQKMRDYYIPWANEFDCYYMVMDTEGKPANTGDGHLMAMWAGAHMELGPLAPMTHHMGGALGVNSYLQLNMEGNRFMNEDIPGQPIANQLSRQPASDDPEAAAKDLKSWQIFDASWPEQIAAMPDGHGYTNHFITDDKAGEYELALSGFGLGYTTKSMVEEIVVEDGGVIANSIEELAAGIKLPLEKVKASITRYNQLCEKGHDDDFGKDSRRLFPVKNPPFYACPFTSAGMLVVMGGIQVNGKLQPLNAQNRPIEGLYIGGNTMGGRYLIEYPVTVAGISLGTSLTFGRLAGLNAAGKGIEA